MNFNNESTGLPLHFPGDEDLFASFGPFQVNILPPALQDDGALSQTQVDEFTHAANSPDDVPYGPDFFRPVGAQDLAGSYYNNSITMDREMVSLWSNLAPENRAFISSFQLAWQMHAINAGYAADAMTLHPDAFTASLQMANLMSYGAEPPSFPGVIFNYSVNGPQQQPSLSLPHPGLTVSHMDLLTPVLSPPMSQCPSPEVPTSVRLPTPLDSPEPLSDSSSSPSSLDTPISESPTTPSSSVSIDDSHGEHGNRKTRSSYSNGLRLGSSSKSPTKKAYCLTCHIDFFDNRTLKRHVAHTHNREGVPCPGPRCGKQLSRWDSLLRHLQNRRHKECADAAKKLGWSPKIVNSIKNILKTEKSS